MTEALEAATCAGYVCSIASGRALCLIGKSVLGIGAMTHAVVANGAEVWDLRAGVRLAHRPMAREDALRVLDALADLEPAWNCFLDGRAYFEWAGVSYLMRGVNGAAARERRRAEHTGIARRVVSFVRRGLRFAKRLALNRDSRQVRSIRPIVERTEGGTDKLGCTLADVGRTDEAVARLRASGRFEVARMGATEIEVTAAGVTKASGATLLMDHLGIRGTDAVAFGDGGNDLPMAEVATFVAMGNADEEVRRRADEVCGTVAEDGVAAWIEARLGV